VTQFSDFQISDALKKRIASLNFVTPTPVQAGAIPPALEGKDVLATAQTGTGKTLSFIVPILEKLAKTESRSATALILLPTRELAMQVENALPQPQHQSGQLRRAGRAAAWLKGRSCSSFAAERV
jgi:ATP-dependent RNA helicase RhlE